MKLRDARARLGLSAVMALAGCTTGATEVQVSVLTDAPSDRVFVLSASVLRGTMVNAGVDSGTPIWHRAAGASNGPVTFGVRPADGDPRNEEAVLVLDAVLEAGAGTSALAFRRSVRFAFTPHTTTSLRVFLPVACAAPATGCTVVPAAQCTVSVRCEEQDLTCGDHGVCVTRDTLPTAGDGGGSMPDVIPPMHRAPVQSGLVNVQSASRAAGISRLTNESIGASAVGCVGAVCITGSVGP